MAFGICIIWISLMYLQAAIGEPTPPSEFIIHGTDIEAHEEAEAPISSLVNEFHSGERRLQSTKCSTVTPGQSSYILSPAQAGALGLTKC